METAGVTLDEATVKQLTTANGHPIPLRNPAGEVVGYYLSPEQMAKAEEEHKAVVAWLDGLWSPEELARIKQRLQDKTRPKRTMADVLQLVEGV